MNDNPLDALFFTFNKKYQQITKEKKPIAASRKLKNVTPVYRQLEFNFDLANDIEHEEKEQQ